MLYLNSSCASKIFEVTKNALEQSASRNSQKYPFIRVDAGSRSRGGKRLLFGVEVADIKAGLAGGKLGFDLMVYSFLGGELKSLSVGEVFGGEWAVEICGRGCADDGLQSKDSEILSVNGGINSSNLTGNLAKKQGGLSVDEGLQNTDSGIQITENGKQITKSEAQKLDNGSFSKNSQISSGEQSGIASLNLSEDRAKNLSYFQLSDKQKSEVDTKIKLIKAQERSKLSVAEFCKVKNLSKTTFYRWKKEYKNGGAVGLADKSGMHRKNTTILKPWMMEFVLSKFRAYGAGNFNITECWDAMHKEMMIRDGYDYIGFLKCEVEPYCDTGVISRFLSNYYKNKKLEYTMITKGADKAKSYLKPSMGDQREIVTRRNECWQIDSSPLDVMARHDGKVVRADILSIIDTYSGRCVADVVTQGNALSLVRLMWRALNTLGKPDYIKGDNGKDYLSRQFQGLLNGLGIYYDAAIAYAGDEKGFVERHFKTLQHARISQTPGYIGFNLRLREQIEQRTAKKDRKAKDENGNKKKTNLKHILELGEIKKLFEAEVLKWDIVNVRRGGKMSPIQKWNSDRATELREVKYSEFLLYAGAGGTRSVQKGGINYNGFRFVSFDMPKVSTPVVVRENIDDVSEIFVFDERGEFLCVAVEESLAKLRADEFNIITKEFKKEMREIKKVIDRAEFSEFTKINASYDLEIMKKAHKESLEPEKWVKSDSVADEIIKKSRELNGVNSGNGDYLNLEPSKKEKKKKLIGWNEMIEKNAV